MLPYQTWNNSAGEWFAELYDTDHQQWVNLGPFEDEEGAALAAVHFLQHE